MVAEEGSAHKMIHFPFATMRSKVYIYGKGFIFIVQYVKIERRVYFYS